MADVLEPRMSIDSTVDTDCASAGTLLNPREAGYVRNLFACIGLDGIVRHNQSPWVGYYSGVVLIYVTPLLRAPFSGHSPLNGEVE
jgi:hypothetical protein